jgi:hypothetical protein
MKSVQLSHLTKYGLLLAIAFALPKCGILVDEDRVVVATIGDRNITTGELRHAIATIPPEERPSIQTRGDVRMALQEFIDREIKTMLADGLVQEAKIDMPVEEAAQYFFATNPDVPDIRSVTDPAILGMTTDYELDAIKEQLSQSIERTRRKLLNERAMDYYVQAAAASGSLTITNEQWTREFERNRDKLFNPARAKVRVIFVPATSPTAQSDAAQVRTRLGAGESYDTLATELMAARKGAAMATTLTDQGRTGRFAEFWQYVMQAQAGAVIGPLFIPGMAAQGPNTQAMPPSFMVCILDQLFPPKEQSFEEAKQFLAPSVLYVEARKKLRQEYAAIIVDKNLPDPSIAAAGMGGGGPIKKIETQQQPQQHAPTEQPGHEGHQH